MSPAFLARLKGRGQRWLSLLAFFSLGCGLLSLAYLLFPPPAANILIIGMDSRLAEGLQARTDSLMLIGVQPAQLRVSILSFPRDLFIAVPRYGSQRINSILLLGEQEQAGSGTALLQTSLSENFAVPVTHYMRLDFAGFVALVDALGGVTVDIPKLLVDNAYPTEDYGTISVRFEPGLQVLNGEQALIYARTRHADDDYARAARQQQIVSGLLARLANPLRWSAALTAFQQAIDTDLSVWDLIRLAPPVLLNRGRYEQLVINRAYILGTAAGHAVPNYEKLDQWLAERFR